MVLKTIYLSYLFYSLCFSESRMNIFSKWKVTNNVNMIVQGEEKLMEPR